MHMGEDTKIYSAVKDIADSHAVFNIWFWSELTS